MIIYIIIRIPVCNGELVDKITILKIKMLKMSGQKLKNVTKEYSYLYPFMKTIGITEEHKLFKELYNINLTLWNYHDWQRVFFDHKEDTDMSDKPFERLDISIFRRLRDEHIINDQRAKVKKKINMLTKSQIVEEKLFTNYQI